MIDSLFFEKISCGALVCKNDSYSTILEANSAFYSMIGYSKKEMEDKFQNRFSELVLDDLSVILKKVNNAINSKNTLDYEFRIKHKTGETIWIHDVATYDPENDVFNVIIMDITYRERILEKVYKLSEIDTLSTLLNRGALESKITSQFENPNNSSQVMILIDLDNFKYINDNMGHIVGDEVISSFGKKLKTFFKKDEIVGRLGGDEFLIYINNVPSEVCVNVILKNLLKQINYTMNGITIESSVGVVYDKNVKYNFSELYHFVDLALYRTKNNKKGSFLLKIV